MSLPNDEASIDRTVSLLEFYKNNAEAIWRIVNLVQKNPRFFEAKLGGSCLSAAADKLEELIKATQ